MNTSNIHKMSDVVIACELRAAWAQVECDLRHSVEPARGLSDYIVALEREQASRRSK